MPTLCVSIFRALNRWFKVALVFIARVIAPLQDRTISKNVWHLPLPELTSSIFFSWRLPEAASVQGKKKKLRTIQELKGNIRLEMANI